MKGYFLALGFILLQWGLSAIADTSSETEVEINARKNVNLWEGDIKLLPGQRAQIERTSDFGGPQNLVLNHSHILWPNGVVPYILDSSASDHPATVKAINEAIEEFHNKTCITLVPRTNEANYVRFIKGRGCWSYVGRIHGSQNVSIGEGCEHKGIVLHEIFHVLGRFHEHSRPDRDKYNRIKESAPSRIVTVSSSANYRGSLDFDNMMWANGGYSALGSYTRSKLANVMFSRELAKRLEGTGVSTYSLHPGVINTELARHIVAGWKIIFAPLLYTLMWFLTKTPKQGAQTTLHCAVSDEAEGITGKYWSNCAVKKPNKLALIDEDCTKLWEYSTEQVKL
ncbi:PREDICTED: zinc metalloproteinase nas-12-like [Amphimedon queenslandica]|uniref:Metalloendopeptidase n=1 Tax=Amphimedon queenslandica TaxID=400682 RepID=A0AAN0JGF7_AMPQE|nr:PREDICTED: zinc metalloproteinase nas-12-like [Amphimedon queenslandica]|eukprot:XP_019855886.1 PREDICTED: zinc metalloproteinase nas-12-like [Amphimedon queenslandica]